jgi:hypothetical protein
MKAAMSITIVRRLKKREGCPFFDFCQITTIRQPQEKSALAGRQIAIIRFSNTYISRQTAGVEP